MQRRLLLAAAAAAISTAAIAGGDDHTPRHGGIFAAGKDADYELVATPQALRLYVYDHGKPKDVSKASARLTLLNGSEKQVLDLQPAGDRLEAAGAFKVTSGSKAVAVVTLGGISTSVRFLVK